MSEINWDAIAEGLAAPFAPEQVEFRVQGKAGDGGNAQVVAYIDARAVMDRLDAVVGAPDWTFDYEPLVIEKGGVQVAKGTLTIHGIAKHDIGDASTFEPTKGTISDALKRAAVHWGVGRYLYQVDSRWVRVGQGGRIPDAELAKLRAALPRPESNGTGAHAETVRMLTPTDNPDARRVINQQAGTDALRAADKPAAAEPADKGGRDWVNLRSRMKRTLDVRTLAAADAICVAACGRNWEQTTDADYEAVYAEVARREAAQAAAARVPEDALEGISGAGGRH